MPNQELDIEVLRSTLGNLVLESIALQSALRQARAAMDEQRQASEAKVSAPPVPPG